MLFLKLSKSRIVSVFSLSIMISACSSETPETKGAQHLERAQAYQNQGQYKAATIEYRNALKNSQDNEKALLGFADMLNDMGRFQDALRLIDERGPEQQSVALMLERSESLIGLRKYHSAEKVFLALQDTSSPEAQYLKGQIALGKGNISQAKRIFMEMTADTQSELSSRAQLGLGLIALGEGKAQQALERVSLIAPESEDYPRSQVLKAGIELNQGDLEKAEKTLTDTLAQLPSTDTMLPEKALVLERLSYVLTRLGRSNEAYVYQKLLAEAFPGANEVSEKYQSAVESFKAQDLELAKSTLESILEEYPSHARSKQLLGVIAYLNGETDAASAYLDSSVDPEVADSLTKQIYAATNLKLNEPGKVLEILGPEAATSESASTLTLYGLAAISAGDRRSGEAALLKAAKLDETNVQIRLALATYYRQFDSSAPNKELAQLELAYQAAPAEREVLQQLLGFYLRQGQTEKASNFAEKMLKKSPKSYSAHMVAGFYDLSQNRPENALEKFEAALQLRQSDDEKVEALYAKGRVQLALAKNDAAKSTFSRMVKEFPQDERAYQGLFGSLLRAEGVEPAREQIQTLGQRNAAAAAFLVLAQQAVMTEDLPLAETYVAKSREYQPDPQRLERVEQAIGYGKAMAALSQQNFKQARTETVTLLRGNPESVRLLGLLTDIEIRDGKFTEAEKLILQIQEIDRTHPVLNVLRADLSLAKGQVREARTYLSDAWALHPTDALGQKLFRVLSELNETKARQEHLDAWLEAFPDSQAALLFKAIAYQSRGQNLRAAELYERLLSINPNSVAALNNLGWLYFEKGDDRAEKTLRSAMALAPDNAAVLDSLGWVLYKAGSKSEALDLMEQAYKLAPENAEIKAHYEEVKGS